MSKRKLVSVVNRIARNRGHVPDNVQYHHSITICEAEEKETGLANSIISYLKPQSFDESRGSRFIGNEKTCPSRGNSGKRC